MKYNQRLLLVIFCSAVFLASCHKTGMVPINTASRKDTQMANKPKPVPRLAVGATEQEFTEVVDGFTDNKRIMLGSPWSDFSPTGYYLLPGETLKLTVTQLAGTALPRLLIGTYSRDTTRWDPRTVTLTAGQNMIAPDTLGGMLWIRFTTNGTPSSKVRIRINSGAVRTPVFIKDQTTDWAAQLAQYTQAPDALLINNNVYVVWNRSRALNTPASEAGFILQTIDKAVDAGENYISGFDGSAPEHQLPVHKIVMVETNKKSVWGVATWYRVAFAPGLLNDCMSAAHMIAEGWGGWHELGHMHQQPAWTWSTLGEVTVNIYTLAAERAINGGGISRLKGTITNKALSYLADTASNKNFNDAAGVINDPFVRLMLFHQLWLAFGDAFYITLHKQTRMEKPVFSSTDNAGKMRYFMLKACSISGKDLTRFFKKWGMPVAQQVYDEIAALHLPGPDVDPSTLTDENTHR